MLERTLRQRMEVRKQSLQTTKNEIEAQLSTVDKVIKLLTNHPEIETFDILMGELNEEKK